MTSDTKGPWLALYSRTLESDTFQALSCAERSVFLQALLLATRVERDVTTCGRTYHLKPGQFITTRAALAKQAGAGCSEKIVRRTIDKLTARRTWANERADERANAPRLITFINWTSYQLSIPTRANERADSWAGSGPTDRPQQRMNGSENDPVQCSYTDSTEKIKIRPRRDNAADKDPVVEAYRRILVPAGMPDVVALTTARQRAIKTALATYGLERLEELFSKAATSAFLAGKVQSDTHPGWRADFDFILRPDTLVHIAEGSRYFSHGPVQTRAADYRRPLGADPDAWAGIADQFAIKKGGGKHG